MKKKISMVLAGLGLCASMVMFAPNTSYAVDCSGDIVSKDRICLFGGNICQITRGEDPEGHRCKTKQWIYE